MRSFFIVLTLLPLSFMTRAQSSEDSVKAVVNNLFTGMKNADTALLASCFADSMVLQTITRDKSGRTLVRTESPAAFIASIGKLPAGAADERIRFETVKVDGPLALAWTPYEFYYNGAYSHCGVNSFQLVRFNGVWRIQYLIDTRRKECSF